MLAPSDEWTAAPHVKPKTWIYPWICVIPGRRYCHHLAWRGARSESRARVFFSLTEEKLPQPTLFRVGFVFFFLAGFKESSSFQTYQPVKIPITNTLKGSL